MIMGNNGIDYTITEMTWHYITGPDSIYPEEYTVLFPEKHTESDDVLVCDTLFGIFIDRRRDGEWMSKFRKHKDPKVVHYIYAWAYIPKPKGAPMNDCLPKPPHCPRPIRKCITDYGPYGEAIIQWFIENKYELWESYSTSDRLYSYEPLYQYFSAISLDEYNRVTTDEEKTEFTRYKSSRLENC